MLSSALNVLFITDGKPGHKNQLLGLEQSLKLQTEVHSQWLSVDELPVSWLDVVCRRVPYIAKQAPDVVVGAGSATHKLMLAIKRKYDCFSVVLMKPSIVPLTWFDAAIIPKHDNPAERDQVLATVGVLNTIRPVDRSLPSQRGLFLVGGESKHYHWDGDGVLEQIQRVIETKPSVKQWIMTDSRRTPDAFRRLIDRLPKDRVSFYHNESTPAGWVQQQLERVDQVWVTPDSVSMVYEAITSGVPTGVFDLQPQKTGRIVLGIEELIKKGQLMTLLGNSEMMQENEPLCEADRAATWLLSRYKLGRDAG